MTINFHVPGKPQAKQRARTLKNGSSYTPKETVNYENLIKLCFHDQVKTRLPIHAPVRMRVFAWYQMPKSLASSKKKKIQALQGKILPTVKPDIDNIAKSVKDALEKIAYRNDSQVISLTIEKKYAEIPGLDVYLTYLAGT